jgi:hypothetical protein
MEGDRMTDPTLDENGVPFRHDTLPDPESRRVWARNNPRAYQRFLELVRKAKDHGHTR